MREKKTERGKKEEIKTDYKLILHSHRSKIVKNKIQTTSKLCFKMRGLFSLLLLQ